MSRNIRIHAPGLIYHVFARGNNRDNIFFEEANYNRFLQNLEQYRSKYLYKIYAYCLMPNHFHLLLEVGSIPLSKIMQVFLTAYTMYFNKKYGRVGHVFQGRFRSIIVEKETYLLEVVRYIHLNPTKTKMAVEPQNYIWSSYQQYLNDIEKSPKIQKSEILKLFSQDSAKQKKLFHEFTKGGITYDFDPFKQQTRDILGSIHFMQRLTKVLKGVRP